MNIYQNIGIGNIKDTTHNKAINLTNISVGKILPQKYLQVI